MRLEVGIENYYQNIDPAKLVIRSNEDIQALLNLLFKEELTFKSNATLSSGISGTYLGEKNVYEYYLKKYGISPNNLIVVPFAFDSFGKKLDGMFSVWARKRTCPCCGQSIP